MNYIYDITLNLNNELYNFYEWDLDDNVEFYLKIPVFKVEDKVINDFIRTKFIIDKKVLNLIKNKTECYNKNSLKINKYIAIFTSLDKALAVSFDENGNSILKSYLSIDEEDEVLEFSKLIKYSLIDYKIKQKISIKNSFITREEHEIKKELSKKIKEIYDNKEYSKLKYVFYEIYNMRIDNINKIYLKLVNLIENNSNKLLIVKKIFDKLRNESKSY